MLMARLLRDHGRTGLAVVVLVALAIVVPLLLVAVPAGSPLHLPSYLVVRFGKYLTFALLAVSIDLIWGSAEFSRWATAPSSRSAAT